MLTGGMTVTPPVSNTAALRIRPRKTSVSWRSALPRPLISHHRFGSCASRAEHVYKSTKLRCRQRLIVKFSVLLPLQSNPHEMSKFTRTINIHRYALNFCGRISSCLTYLLLSKDLGVEATLLLTFDDQPMPGMYQTYFPTAWRYEYSLSPIPPSWRNFY